MVVGCLDRERIFLDGTDADWAALKAHAADCAGCEPELRAWLLLSEAAAELRDYREVPALWPRIASALEQQMAEQRLRRPSRSSLLDLLPAWRELAMARRLAAAALLVAVFAVSISWFYLRPRGAGGPQPKSGAPVQAELSEAEYARDVDLLEQEAKPELENPTTSVLVSYREKIMQLNGVIDELRAKTGRNPADTSLRRQLLATYREKQETLEKVLQEKPPVPAAADSAELVTTAPEVLSTPEQRSAAIAMLSQARQNLGLQGQLRVQVSFTATGHSAYEGTGTLEETWLGPRRWEWHAQLANSVQSRVLFMNNLYGTPSDVPLRIQMVWDALFNSTTASLNAAIRTAAISYKGADLTCLLFSRRGTTIPSGDPRAWNEDEYCIDPASGRLQTWSAAPGLKFTYDYDDAVPFRGHMVPRQIFVVEDGYPVLKIRVESITEASPVDAATVAALQPAAEVLAQGPTFSVGAPDIRALPVGSVPNQSFVPAKQVIVLAMVGHADGKVIEAETLQSSDQALTQAALDAVRKTTFAATGLQREFIVDVQFAESAP